MSVQDLTNTTWVFNNILDISFGDTVRFGLSFTSGNTNYTELVFFATDDDEIHWQNGTTSLEYSWVMCYYYPQSGYAEGVGIYSEMNEGWYISDNAYKTITITGGTDVTNASLISWLEANATQQGEQVTIDLSTLSGWSSVTAGQHTLTIKAKAQGYRDSNPSVGVSFTKAAVYSINASIQHASLSGDISIIAGGTATVTVVPNQGYGLPSTLTSVTNAQYSYDNTTGVITLSNATGEVLILGECPASGYQVRVTGNLSDAGSIAFYDGQDMTSPLLYMAEELAGVESFDETLTVSSGYLCCSYHAAYDSTIGTPSSGITVISTEPSLVLYQVTSNGSILGFDIYGCLIEGTQITLADGSKKAVEDITYDDNLLVWNFYEGKFDVAKPQWIMQPATATRYNLVKFEDGTELGLVGSNGYHRIFNKEAGAFTHTGTDDTPNGTTTLTEHNIFVKVVSQEIINKPVRYYNIITRRHFNLFANGILTSCKLSNKYKIENMKYVGEQLISEEEEKAYFENIDLIKQ